MNSSFKGLAEIWATSPTVKRDYRGVLNLSSNELAHPLHEAFVQRWLRGISPGTVARYPYYPEIQERLANRLGRRGSEVLLVAGADEGARILCMALGRAYSQMFATWPNYLGYKRYCELAGIAMQRIDVAAHAMLPDTKEPSLIVLTDPDPVSGEMMSAAGRAAWVEAERVRQHLLFVDEAYVGFDGAGPFDEPWARASLRTFSKSLGAAGLRLAALIVPQEIGDYLARWSPSNAVSAISLDFLGYALDHEREIAGVAREVARVRDALLHRGAAELHRWRFSNSRANFVAFSLPTAQEAATVARELAHRQIVVKTFGDAEDGDARMLRMTIVDQARMDKVMDLLVKLHERNAHG